MCRWLCTPAIATIPSFDCLLHSLMQRKRKLASSALWPMGDTDSDVGELQKLLATETAETAGDPVRSAVAAMFERDGQPSPSEPHRVCRRLQTLRRWSHDKQ